MTRRGNPFPPSRGGRPQWPVLCALHRAGLDWDAMAPYVMPGALTSAKKRYSVTDRYPDLVWRDAELFLTCNGISRKIDWTVRNV
jgi:hypothetical protein